MSYTVRFPFEQLNQLSDTVSKLVIQVNNLTSVMTQLSQNITTLEGEPGFVLPSNAIFTAVTCFSLSYLDDDGNELDLETEIEGLKTLNTSYSDEAKNSADNAAQSATDAAAADSTYASYTVANQAAINATDSATAAANSATAAANMLLL